MSVSGGAIIVKVKLAARCGEPRNWPGLGTFEPGKARDVEKGLAEIMVATGYFELSGGTTTKPKGE